LTACDFFPSNAEAQRKIKEGAVYMATPGSDPPSWERLTDPNMEFSSSKYSSVIFRIGPRRVYRVTFTPRPPAA